MRNFEDLERFALLIEPKPWVFAKTLKKNPHHYTLGHS